MDKTLTNVGGSNMNPIITLTCRIEFEVESEEVFNELKDVSRLEGETWTLIEKQEQDG